MKVDGTTGSAHWDADYTFSVTGRRVHNAIDARFTFSGGKIVEHVDTFDLWCWMGMALGLKGKLVGWAPFAHNVLRKTAARGLDAWIEKKT